MNNRYLSSTIRKTEANINKCMKMVQAGYIKLENTDASHHFNELRDLDEAAFENMISRYKKWLV